MDGEFFIHAGVRLASVIYRLLLFLAPRGASSVAAIKIELEGRKEEPGFFPGEQLRMSYRSSVIGCESSRKRKTISHAQGPNCPGDCVATFLIEILREGRRRVNRRQCSTSSCYVKHESLKFEKRKKKEEEEKRRVTLSLIFCLFRFLCLTKI